MRVPKDKIGLVIGRGGDTIKQIQHEAKCKLNIEQNTEIDGDRIVTVTGTAEAIALARELINEKVGVVSQTDVTRILYLLFIVANPMPLNHRFAFLEKSCC